MNAFLSLVTEALLGPGTPFCPEFMAVAWALEPASPGLGRALEKVNPRHF